MFKLTSLQKIKNLLLDIFFPESCITCSKFGEIICEECREEIKKDKANIENIKNINWIHANLSYKNKNLKKILFSIKYYYLKSISRYIAKIVYLDFFIFIKEKISKIDLDKGVLNYEDLVIIPIPISKKRLIERNYNQTEIIIKDIIKEIKENINSENLNLENNIYIDLLIKNKHTIKFADTHSANEREKLIKDAFNVDVKYNKEFLKDKTIIIFDDITTTGSTFYEARNTLVAKGAKRENIFGYSVAH